MADIDTIKLGSTSYSIYDNSLTHNFKDGTNTGAVKKMGSSKNDGIHSFAEGYNCTASGSWSHAEGYATIAGDGDCAHAEGRSTTATGAESHAEGYLTEARGDVSHAGGRNTIAEGYCSHAHGYYTKTSNSYEYACGTYNTPGYLFSIGNGTSDTDRNNAFAVDINGRIYPRSAMDNPIGHVVTSSLSSNKSIANSTYTPVCSVTLSRGVWFINMMVRFSSNSTGERAVNLGSSGTSARHYSVKASPSGITQINFCRWGNVDDTATWYLNAWQNSGSSLTLSSGDNISCIHAVRVA